MDLRLLLPIATDAERAAVDAVLGSPASTNGTGAPRGPMSTAAWRTAVTRRVISATCCCRRCRRSRPGSAGSADGALNYICERLTVPPADAYGVATFYGLLSVEPRPPRVLHVCEDVACQLPGLRRADAVARAAVRPRGAEDCDGAAWLRSPCLGQCDRAPAALLTEAGAPPARARAGAGRARPRRWPLEGDPVPEPPPASVPQQGEQGLRLLRRIGVVDPHSLHDYRAPAASRRCAARSPSGRQAVIREVKDSGLMGRGGAAFPTGVKWEAVSQQPAQPHYLICNADESEPGTFKDRVMLEGDPFAVIESMTIAAYATGCSHGYIYLRGDIRCARDPRARAGGARHHGYLGVDILGEGFDFDIEIRSGAGAYICGEETAIFNSIEGYRGEPRAKPPFPLGRGSVRQADRRQQRRDAGQRALDPAQRRPRVREDRHREVDRDASCSACRATCTGPGVYEVPFGETLGELLERAGESRQPELQAVLLGGAAGRVRRSRPARPALTFEGARAAGATLGSGVVVAFDDTVDLRPILLRIAGFFRDESCGQCTPCRVGTVRQEEALARLLSGKTRGGVDEELAVLDGSGHVHARLVDLRSGADRCQRRRLGDQQARSVQGGGGVVATARSEPSR